MWTKNPVCLYGIDCRVVCYANKERIVKHSLSIVLF